MAMSEFWPEGRKYQFLFIRSEHMAKTAGRCQDIHTWEDMGVVVSKGGYGSVEFVSRHLAAFQVGCYASRLPNFLFQIWIDFLNSFSVRKSAKFPLKYIQYYPPYLKHIAALHRQVRCPVAHRAGNSCFISFIHSFICSETYWICSEQPRPQFGQRQNTQRRTAASVLVADA